jgi:ABC-type lipoprotein release transport system permease subunit
MKDRVVLALKNLRRYGRRTVITAAAIAVGLAMYLVLDSMLLGIERESEINLIRYETASAAAMTEAYWEERDERPLEHLIEEPQAVIEELEAAGVPATRRTVFPAELVVDRDPYPEDGSLQGLIHAIDPDQNDAVLDLRDSVTEGQYLQADEHGVVIGAWLADKLGAEVGYPLTIVTRTREGFYQTLDLEITGILNSPNPVVNRSGIYISYHTADTFLQMDGAASEILMRFPGYVDAEERAAELEARLAGADAGAGAGAGAGASAGVLPELTVQSWKKLAADFVALAEAKSAGSGVILFLVFVIAAVGISNTMLMAVFERVREIGMLRALGMKDGHIRQLFLFEAAGIGLLGAAIGLLLGAAGVHFMVSTGLDFTWMFREMDLGYRSVGIMYGVWHPAAFLQAFLIGVGLAVAMAYIPTRHALKVDIPTALHHQ